MKKYYIILTAVCFILANGIVLAHTEVESSVSEGTGTTNNLIIGHGCEDTKLPITAQSVILPTVDPIVTRSDGGSTSLQDELNGVDSVGLKGIIKPIQDRNIFDAQGIKTDTLGNIIGFYGKNGKLMNGLLGKVPFMVVAPTFKSTSCANKLFIRLAVADICKRNFPPKSGLANLWIPANTTKFTDTQIDGIGEPPALVITRAQLPNSCGAGYDVIVEPSATDVDTNLPIKGYWGK